ncbi:Aste57867_22709 [Aphanomyces stellatus]|uniref:Aste57867_22709 protein n=1 Tax=Aphanomyces stellatus TaxID=120398 RepID=A0A485LLD4_9STRA|nr:hypothetical protein As57867_022639 [Aphanomyces stellatus]VFT99363.1 Aste57867_22709 [Aphanomyces stellatus]
MHSLRIHRQGEAYQVGPPSNPVRISWICKSTQELFFFLVDCASGKLFECRSVKFTEDFVPANEKRVTFDDQVVTVPLQDHPCDDTEEDEVDMAQFTLVRPAQGCTSQVPRYPCGTKSAAHGSFQLCFRSIRLSFVPVALQYQLSFVPADKELAKLIDKVMLQFMHGEEINPASTTTGLRLVKKEIVFADNRLVATTQPICHDSLCSSLRYAKIQVHDGLVDSPWRWFEVRWTPFGHPPNSSSLDIPLWHNSFSPLSHLLTPCQRTWPASILYEQIKVACVRTNLEPPNLPDGFYSDPRRAKQLCTYRHPEHILPRRTSLFVAGYVKVFNLLKQLSRDPWLKQHLIPDAVQD